MTIKYRICNIPCQIYVFDIEFEQGYYYVDFRFKILDRKGYDAPWLEKKITKKMELEIEKEIINQLENR